MERFCGQCNTRLARDNSGEFCAACHKKTRDVLIRPPVVPAQFWESEQMRRALATRHMGKIERAFRTHAYARPISQSVAAPWFFLTQAQLSRIESGPPMQNMDRLVQWAHILRIPADLLWFPLPDDADHTNDVDHADDADHEWQRMADLSRNTFVERGIGAITLPAIGLDELRHIASALTDARRYADHAVVDHFLRRLDECAAHDRRCGPKRGIPMIMGLIAAIEQLAREAKTEIRLELLRVAARAAELAGWFYRDIVMPELANYWRDRAMEWAQAAGDASMQGYVLLKKSQTAWDDRDGLRMLTLAQAAHDGPWRLPPHILAEAAQQQARAQALLGHPLDAVERRLDQARVLLDRHDPAAIDPAARLSTHYCEALFNLQLAACYCEAGQAERALDRYDAWLAPGAFSRRDYGYFLSLKGLAYAAAEAPDEAAQAGLRALTLARETNSARTYQEVLRVADRLGRWRARADVDDLYGALLT